MTLHSMPPLADVRNAYSREGVSSSSPERLLVMLYDRLLLDLHRAEAAQLRGDWTEALGQLFHAQSIVLELSSTLRVDLWDGGEGLLSIYGYASRTIARASVTRDATATREVIRVVEPLAEAWRAAASQSTTPSVPRTSGDLGVA